MASKENPSAAIDDLLASMVKPKIKPEILLAELDELLRNRPTPDDIFNQSGDAIAWMGRAAATLGHWDETRGNAILMVAETQLHSGDMRSVGQGLGRLIALLNEARHSTRMAAMGPLNVAVEKGMVFDYFDGLRKIVERANADLLFIDPYLDADFVSRYLAYVHPGISIRLLAGQKKLATPLPAVDAFAKQSGAKIAVRSTDQIHDRFVFVDGKECYQSGSSFKDGANKVPTTLTQITDAFSAMSQTYEGIWATAKVERSA